MGERKSRKGLLLVTLSFDGALYFVSRSPSNVNSHKINHDWLSKTAKHYRKQDVEVLSYQHLVDNSNLPIN